MKQNRDNVRKAMVSLLFLTGLSTAALAQDNAVQPTPTTNPITTAAVELGF